MPIETQQEQKGQSTTWKLGNVLITCDISGDQPMFAFGKYGPLRESGRYTKQDVLDFMAILKQVEILQGE